MLSLMLAAQVVILTQGGSIYQVGPSLGGTQGAFYFHDANVTGGFPGRCFSGGAVHLSYTTKEDETVALAANDLAGCNVFDYYAGATAGSYYNFDATFSGVDSRGDPYVATITGTDRWYRRCTRTCQMYLHAPSWTVTIDYGGAGTLAETCEDRKQ